MFFENLVISVGGFVPWELGRFAPWDVLSLGRFVPRTFCPWDLTSPRRFVPWDVLSRDVLSVHPLGNLCTWCWAQVWWAPPSAVCWVGRFPKYHAFADHTQHHCDPRNTRKVLCTNCLTKKVERFAKHSRLMPVCMWLYLYIVLRKKCQALPVLWIRNRIRIRIGSVFRSFVDPDPDPPM